MRNNKLIAEFMGNIPIFENEYQMVTHNNMCYGVDELKYHTDWNWLMEVVERIENFGFEFFIVESRCKIAHNTDHSIETIIDFEIIGTKLQATYKAVVEFIKWYNNESKTS